MSSRTQIACQTSQACSSRSGYAAGLKAGRQTGDDKSDPLHKGYQPAGHRRMSGVIQRQHRAQRKRAAQSHAAGNGPERREMLWQPDKAAEANQL